MKLQHEVHDEGRTCLNSDSYTLLSFRLTSCGLLTRFGLFNADMGSMVSSCAKLETPFVSGGLGTGFPAADWLEATLVVEGTVPGLFFLMGGSRFFLNGGRVTVVGPSLAASGSVVKAVALVDDSASGAAATSTFPSGSSGDKASSLGRFDPPGWSRSRTLVGGGLRSIGLEASSSLSIWPFILDVGLRFDLVSARGGDSS